MILTLLGVLAVASALGVVVLGGIYMVLARPYERGNAPSGDAHLLKSASSPAASAVVHG